MNRTDAYRMIQRRARDADVETKIGCHSFRATGITNYLQNGGTLDVNQPYCLLRQKYTGLPLRNLFPELQAGRRAIFFRTAAVTIRDPTTSYSRYPNQCEGRSPSSF
jgi:hypothetical protein